jgi:hypothetical protein
MLRYFKKSRVLQKLHGFYERNIQVRWRTRMGPALQAFFCTDIHIKYGYLKHFGTSCIASALKEREYLVVGGISRADRVLVVAGIPWGRRLRRPR